MRPSRTSQSAFLLLVGTIFVPLLGCGGGSDSGPSAPAEVPAPDEIDVLRPATARWRQVEEFKADLAAPRHPSDGGGEVRLEQDLRSIVLGSRGSFTLLYTVGPLGIAEGGALYFMPDPFWGWSAPQIYEPRAPGFTRVRTEADGVTLDSETLGGAMLMVLVTGRALVEGETITLEYGAGEVGVVVDRHAERGSRLWVGVDGDGDGVRRMLLDSPTVDVLPGPPARLVATATSVVRPGSSARVTIAVLDRGGNSVTDVVGEVRLEVAGDSAWDLERTLPLQATDIGSLTVELEGAPPGVHRVRATLELESLALESTSNPILVDADADVVLWGDLHGHSNYSDGTGLPEDYFRYARDVAALDVVCLTDHDHFGVLFLDQHPDMWAEIKAQVDAFHDPGRFVTLLGFEWTSWIHGHRHVVYFEDDGEVISSLDPETETPRQLWDRLEGRKALTYAHHSAGEPIPTNWSFRPDPVLEPITEVMSVHGSSEAADSPSRVRGGLAGHYVRDVLDSGVELGFIGSGDSHDGHPGLPHLSPVYGYAAAAPGGGQERMGTGGVAAILAPEHTREGVLEAMRARRVYATSGPRIILAVDFAGHRMGETVAAAELPAFAPFNVRVIGTAPIDRLDLVRSGQIAGRIPANRELEWSQLWVLENLEAGEYVYVRATQHDGAIAWSSPVFVR